MNFHLIIATVHVHKVMQHGICHMNKGRPKFHICKVSLCYSCLNYLLVCIQYRNVNAVALVEYYTSVRT
jgi:hypothetical protein